MLARVVLPREIAAALPRLAAAALPREACALMTGRRSGDALVITGLAPSSNLAAAGDAFEIDTALHLRLQRRTRAVAAIWHSHPSGAAIPSARDAAGAWDQGLAWIITARGETTAWLPLGEGRGFAPLPLVPA
ncbi:Mov34/MPN/PAD-1 family protein [Elioraea sp.]|uniref:Mov34/MPN/PAD-1 family protein n=1 Tax=Elioraea sp. TaxID=2185103 RepID=UPI0025C023EF|nr:Mov34/MPN/PAD-1 family protein [Elioraea sp.]